MTTTVITVTVNTMITIFTIISTMTMFTLMIAGRRRDGDDSLLFDPVIHRQHENKFTSERTTTFDRIFHRNSLAILVIKNNDLSYIINVSWCSRDKSFETRKLLGVKIHVKMRRLKTTAENYDGFSNSFCFFFFFARLASCDLIVPKQTVSYEENS